MSGSLLVHPPPTGEGEHTITVSIEDGYLWGAARLPVEVLSATGVSVATEAMVASQSVGFRVAPGNYVVRMRLPNGEWLTHSADARASDENLTFRIAHTKHEWLARQELTGECSDRTVDLDHPDLGLTWYRVWSGDPPHVIPSPSSKCDAADAVKFEIDVPEFQGVKFFQIGGPRVPWQIVTLPPVGEIDVTVCVDSRGRIEHGSPSLQVSVIPRDWDPEWLLRYLNIGAISSAKQVFDHSEIAERYLYQKISDPIAATVAGYYLLRIDDRQRMHDWPNNLADWFPWLPDGPIIHAWQLLRDKGESARAQARARLLESVGRGFPLFTEGVRLLIDGLRLLAEPDDVELRQAREANSELAAAVDWTRALVSFPGADPRSPSLERHTGVPTQRDLSVLKHTDVPTHYTAAVALAGSEERAAEIVTLSARVLALREQPWRAVSLLEGAARQVSRPQALEWLEQALELGPQLDTSLLAAEIAFDLGQLPRALRWVRLAARLDPDEPNLMLRVGDLTHLSGDSEQAMLAYERVLSLNPSRTDALARIGELAVRSGDPERGLEMATRAAAVDTDAGIRLYRRIADLCQSRGHIAQAAACYGHIAELGKPDPLGKELALSNLAYAAHLYETVDQHDAALDAYRRIASILLDDPFRIRDYWFDALHQLVELNVELGEREAALAAYSRLVELFGTGHTRSQQVSIARLRIRLDEDPGEESESEPTKTKPNNED